MVAGGRTPDGAADPPKRMCATPACGAVRPPPRLVFRPHLDSPTSMITMRTPMSTRVSVPLRIMPSPLLDMLASRPMRDLARSGVGTPPGTAGTVSLALAEVPSPFLEVSMSSDTTLSLASMDELWAEIHRRFASPGSAALVYRHNLIDGCEYICRATGGRDDLTQAIRALRKCCRSHKERS